MTLVKLVRALRIALSASGDYIAGRISEEEMKERINEGRALLGKGPLP